MPKWNWLKFTADSVQSHLLDLLSTYVLYFRGVQIRALKDWCSIFLLSTGWLLQLMSTLCNVFLISSCERPVWWVTGEIHRCKGGNVLNVFSSSFVWEKREKSEAKDKTRAYYTITPTCWALTVAHCNILYIPAAPWCSESELRGLTPLSATVCTLGWITEALNHWDLWPMWLVGWLWCELWVMVSCWILTALTDRS